MSQALHILHANGTPVAARQPSSRLAELASVDAGELLPSGSQLAIVAPHPDDEILGCGGLLAQLARRQDVSVGIITVTDGEASHPQSRAWTAHRLRRERGWESQLSLRRLGFSPRDLQWSRLRFADGKVARDETRLVDTLWQLLEGYTHVITTWHADGHGDHEAVGRASAVAAEAWGCQLYEVPVWAWRWAAADDSRLPWDRARRLALDAQALARKQTAIQAHRSQLLPDASTGADPVLTEAVLARFTLPHEILFV